MHIWRSHFRRKSIGLYFTAVRNSSFNTRLTAAGFVSPKSRNLSTSAYLQQSSTRALSCMKKDRAPAPFQLTDQLASNPKLAVMGGGPAKDKLLIAIPEPEPRDLVNALRQKFPQIDIEYREVTFTFDLTKLNEQIPAEVWKDVTILFTLSAFPKETSLTPKLGFVQLMSAGSNQIQNHPLYTETEIPICTATGVHGPQISECVIYTALVHSHGFKKLYENQKRHIWDHGDFVDKEGVGDRVGKRIGILGYGSIGRQVGRVAKAMGMTVLAYTASKKDTPEKKKDNGFIVPGTGDRDGVIPDEWFSGLDKESLHHFLSQKIDWLVVAVPLTKQTRHFLSTPEFRVLSRHGKTKPYITNIARGSIVDQPALIKALKDGTLGGAALDVTDPEPLPEDSELWGLENVIVTPHVSGSTSVYTERAMQVLEENLRRWEGGERLINAVDRERGY